MRRFVRRRDRHDRGLRGSLVPAAVPLHRSAAQTFDDLVLGAVERLEPAWGKDLDEVDIVVVDIPPPLPVGLPSEQRRVPLGRAIPKTPGHRARLVFYRRPLELRGGDRLAEVVGAVVVEQVAELLGRSPEEIDPHYER